MKADKIIGIKYTPATWQTKRSPFQSLDSQMQAGRQSKIRSHQTLTANMKKTLQVLLTACLAASASTASAAKYTQSEGGNPAKRSAHYRQQTGDLPNFHEVHPYLYRGGEPTKAGLRKLKEMGVATIIDLRGSPEQVYNEEREAKVLGMKTINLPMSSQAPTKKQVETFLCQVESAAKGQNGGAVFVHCAHGSDRTGCMVGIWRVTHENWSYDQAYREMRKYYFTPKFTKLSGSVRNHAIAQQVVGQETTSQAEGAH